MCKDANGYGIPDGSWHWHDVTLKLESSPVCQPHWQCPGSVSWSRARQTRPPAAPGPSPVGRPGRRIDDHDSRAETRPMGKLELIDLKNHAFALQFF